jgi:solute carrier family 25 phosphate transporter 3
LCPFEAVKVRIQTSKAGTFPTDFAAAFNKIKLEEGRKLIILGNNGLFKGLVPLWCRQVPYTVVKFVAFEYIVEKFYQKVLTKPKNEYSKAT